MLGRHETISWRDKFYNSDARFQSEVAHSPQVSSYPIHGDLYSTHAKLHVCGAYFLDWRLCFHQWSGKSILVEPGVILWDWNSTHVQSVCMIIVLNSTFGDWDYICVVQNWQGFTCWVVNTYSVPRCLWATCRSPGSRPRRPNSMPRGAGFTSGATFHVWSWMLYLEVYVPWLNGQEGQISCLEGWFPLLEI